MKQPPLRFLDFESTDDGLGWVTLEAMVEVSPTRKDEVLAEWARVWSWAHENAQGPQGPLDEGGEWDGCVSENLSDDGWWAAVFTLTGSEAFVAAFDAAFV